MGSRDDIAELYSALDIVCLTSKNEGLPFVLLEAMANSKTIIASNVGSVSELLGDKIFSSQNYEICERGILVNNLDRQSFCDAIGQISFDLKLRNEFGENGVKFIGQTNSASENHYIYNKYND